MYCNIVFTLRPNSRDPSTSEESIEALKIVSKESSAEMQEFIEAEIEILSAIRHENIVELRHSQQIDGAWYMRMEILEVWA